MNFDTLVNGASERVVRRLQGFTEYFRRFWLQSVGPINFSVFGIHTRTNNAIGTYHADLLHTLGENPPFLRFIFGLQTIQARQFRDLNAMEQGQVIWRQPRSASMFRNCELQRGHERQRRRRERARPYIGQRLFAAAGHVAPIEPIEMPNLAALNLNADGNVPDRGAEDIMFDVPEPKRQSEKMFERFRQYRTWNEYKFYLWNVPRLRRAPSPGPAESERESGQSKPTTGDPPAADGQGGGRGDDQRIPRADGAEPRQDNPLEQLIGNPLFQAMARAPAVNAVGNCRLPAFWRSDPDLWFLQVEAQFNIHQVTSDSTRFNMILTVLDPETISEVSDIIRAPAGAGQVYDVEGCYRRSPHTDSPDTQLHTSYSAPSSLETRSHRSFYCRCVRSPAHERQTTSYAYAGLTCCPTQRDGCSRSSKTRPLMSSRPSQTSYTPSDPRHDLAHQHRIEARPRGTAGTTRDTATWQSSAEARACVHTPRPVRKTRCADPSLGARGQHHIERRLYVTDRTYKIRFLIDSGSVLSILPRTVVRKPLQRKTLELQAANGTTIATYGQHSLTLNLGLRRPFEWAFTIARVDVAIIGADLLSHFGLLIDLRNRRLLDNQTSLSTSCQVGPAPQVHTISVAATGVPVGPCVDAYDAILAEFASDKARPGEMATIVDFPVQHRIVTSGQPVFCPPSAPRRRSTRSREGRIQEAARSGHHQAFIEPVGQSTAPRAEAWKHLEDHGRLPLAQRPYSTGSTPSAYHRGLASRERRQGLFGRGSVQGVLPDPGRRRRHLEDGRHDTFRPLRV
ncbi:unnamed protein product, partial [Trichogramma brassicae]